MPTLSGCFSSTLVDMIAGSPQESELEYQAEMQNGELAQDVDVLLTHIWEGDWAPPAGGNVRVACDNGQGDEAYYFYGSWFTTEDAALPGDGEVAKSAISGLRGWLESEGWSALEEFDFTPDVGGVNAFGVEGTKPDAGIYGMQAIYYYEGDLEIPYPHVVVDIDSDCLVVDL